MSTKTVYLFDGTGKFTGQYEAQESPLEPGVFIAPSISTEVAPPQLQAGEHAQWDGAAWVVHAPAPAPAVDPQGMIATKKAQLRTVREGILNRLSGIALAAQLTGDTVTTSAYLVVRQGLLDITENLPTDATIDGVVMYRYASLVGACTPEMVTAFAQVDA